MDKREREQAFVFKDIADVGFNASRLVISFVVWSHAGSIEDDELNVEAIAHFP